MRLIKYFLVSTILLQSISLIAQKPLGIQLYTFRKELAKDVPGTLEKIHKMGIKLLEGGGLYGMTADEFKQLLKKYELTIVSVGADFNELDSNVQRVVDRAKLFNAKFVMCAWIPHKGTEFGPKKIEITEAKTVAWCGCKHSKNAPFCDGSHSKLP